MLVTIKGYYDNGKIILEETPAVTEGTAVLLTFNTEEKIFKGSVKRKLGGLEGMVNLPKDFNAPLNNLKNYM